MAEIVLTPLLQVVFEKVASRVLKEIANRCGFKDEILKLQRSLRMIQAVLEDAEERQAADKALKLWLTELKEVAYDADDLLEEFTPEAMLLQNENTSTQLIPSLNPVIAYLRKLPELNQIRQRLDVLLEERSCFKLKETVGDKDMKGREKRETGSFVVEPEVIGREEDKEKTIQMLLLTTERSDDIFVSVIPIVGLGGIGEEYFVFEGGRMPRNFAKLRYVSVVCDSGSCTIPEALYKAKKLRTLIFLYPRGDLGEVPSKLFSSFKYLRVLDLGNCGIKRVQDTISSLKYLRYLNLSNTLIEMLSESICRLHNLQVLNLSGCSDLIELPRNLARMLRLRHLVIYGCERLTCLPGNIWRLRHLQTLSLFIVAHETNLRENGNLRELSQLQLKGELTIRKLENVKREFLAQANLKEKSLHSLELSWGDDHEGLNLNTGNDFICKMGENVLEWLQPPENLKRLSLKGYPGISFPRFMSTFKLRALTKLELINCKRCDHLPTLGELPFLEIIYMHRMNAVKTIGREFYGEDTRRLFGSLKELTLIDFPDLELWWSISGGNEFKSLVKLTISKCPRLMNMPQFQSVKHLELRNCQETLLRSVVNVSSLSTLVIDVFTGQLLLLDNLLQNNVNLMCLTISSCAQLRYIPPSLGNLVSLKTLAVRWCEELVSMPLQLQNLSSLQSLEISECHSLSAPPQSITGLISLKHLSIENCSNITLLPIGLQHLSSLEHLTIMYCPSLVSLPNEWQNLSILRSLCILSCPQLSFLPDSIQYVRTLQNLEIHGCPGLNALPEWIINLSLLRSLAISDCPNITSLPDNLQCLSKLQRLSIQECPRLEEHYKKNTGHGWPKIAHIAHIYIGSPEIKKENVAGSSLR
ncbi:hypothetical protein V6N12_070731 [Hibiscus sabdariffa]|uniref:Rx N-terminal domain-containing protein n=2 Tax=Hibiscus sabdariffa TaxID=183260 RepID=A0ABR2FHN9_9ROSI